MRRMIARLIENPAASKRACNPKSYRAGFLRANCRNGNTWIFLVFLLAGFLRYQQTLAAASDTESTVAADEQPLTIKLVGPNPPSSFRRFLLMRAVNRSTATWDLAEAYAASQVFVDGKSSKRTNYRWGGISSFFPGQAWGTCLQFEDYEPRISPGPHKVRLKFGALESNAITVDWVLPRSTATLTALERLHEIKEFAPSIKEEIPRDCVEMWFAGRLHDPDPSVRQAATDVLHARGIYHDQ